MAYQPHTLVTFGGRLSEVAANDEIWQCGVRGFQEGGGPIGDADLDDLALEVLRGPTGAGGGLEGIFPDTQGYIPTTVSLDWCKAANIGPDGNYTAEPGIAQIPGGIAGGYAPAAPSFCSVVISWSTGKSLGLAVRGRIYPPNFAAPRDVGATITTGARTGLVNWGNMVLACMDTSLLDVVFHPYVVSSAGVSNPITGVRVGNVYDTQRRRRNAVAESYAAAAFTP